MFTAFESGLIMVNNALIGTTEFEIFSINPATCAENWRTHLDYPGALLPANRGAAYMDGMLFRGTQDCRVLAFDFKTGKQVWETTICDPKHGESVPSAPIAWDGLVYVGNAGGDFKGGKGHVYALEGKTGKIVWEFFLVPKVEGDVARGPLGKSPLDPKTWNNAPGIPISGGGPGPRTRSTSRTACCTSPEAIRRPTSLQERAKATNLYTDSVVVLDAKTGDFKNNFKVVTKDWHDFDVSNPPILLQTMGGKQLMAVAPKDGHLRGYDLATNNLLYRVPVTTIENDEGSISPSARTCISVRVRWEATNGTRQASIRPRTLSSPAPSTGATRWRSRMTRSLRSVAVGQPFTGIAYLNPINMFGKEVRTDGHWAGWIYASDADTGVWKWRAKSNYPFVAAITPTAGGIVFVADLGGNFYALDSSTGQKLWGGPLGTGGAIGGGVITYTVDGVQKVAVADGFTMVAWPTKPRHARVVSWGWTALPRQMTRGEPNDPD